MKQLALVGYGKMGKLLDALADQYGFTVALRLDEHNNAGQSAMTVDAFAGIDVAIEFSTPEVCLANIERLCALGVNTVVGTTGWTAHLPTVRQQVDAAGIGFVWSPNYSIGVNVFERVAAEAARLMAAHEEYGAWAWEIHHHTKKDAPSGTLLQLVKTMRDAGYERPIDQAASRAGAHPGTHEIGFDSAADTITLRHAARSREGFARGALTAARWLAQDGASRRRGFYQFSEILFQTESVNHV
jgi:4-hydroxy-tetrahydrodipicolinate reductase